jgi:hypothetical protein
MALPNDLSIRVTLDFCESETTPKLIIEDTTNYGGLGIPLSAVVGNFIVTGPPNGQTLHQNSSLSSPDIDANVSLIFESDLGCITGDWCGDFTVTYTVNVNGVPYTKVFNKNLCFTVNPVVIRHRIDCYAAALFSTDCTKYAQQGAVPVFNSYEHTIASQNAAPLDLSATTTTYESGNPTTSLIYPDLYTGLHTTTVSADITYDYGGEWYVRWCPSGSDNFDAQCTTDVCKLNCCLEQLLKRYLAACQNPREAKELKDILQTAGALMAIFRQLLYCGYEDKASAVANTIRDIAGCTDDCGCKDCGDPCDPVKVLPIIKTDAAVQDIVTVSGCDDVTVTLDDSVEGIKNYVVCATIPDLPAVPDIVQVLAGTGGVTVDVATPVPGTTTYTVNVEHPSSPAPSLETVVTAGTPNVTIDVQTDTPAVGQTTYEVSVTEGVAAEEIGEVSVGFSSATLNQKDGPAQFAFDLNFIKKSPEIATVALSKNGGIFTTVTINSPTTTDSFAIDDYYEWQVTLAGGETKGSISYRKNYT